MNPEYINPFIQSVVETFEQMLKFDLESGEPVTIIESGETDDLIGVIGLSGTAQGTVAIRFPEETAVALVGDLVDQKFTELARSQTA